MPEAKSIAKKVGWSIIRPSSHIPFLSDHSNPFEDNVGFLHRIKEYRARSKAMRDDFNEGMKTIKEITKDKSDIDNYTLWREAHGVKQEYLIETVFKRVISGLIFLVLSMAAFAYGVTLLNGSSVIDVKSLSSGLVIGSLLLYSFCGSILGLRFIFQGWCIKYERLPSFSEWILTLKLFDWR